MDKHSHPGSCWLLATAGNLRLQKGRHENRLREAALLQPSGQLSEPKHLQQAGGCFLCSRLQGVGPLRAPDKKVQQHARVAAQALMQQGPRRVQASSIRRCRIQQVLPVLALKHRQKPGHSSQHHCQQV